MNSVNRWLASLALASFALCALAAPTEPPAAAAGTPLTAATFAGGCFWCMEAAFDEVPGVVSTTSGYTGGHVAHPTYRQVSSGGTGHVEAVRVVYDPAKVSYARLLDAFWHNVDPLDGEGQFCDRGSQYRSVIFYQNEDQKRLAEASKASLEHSGRFAKPIVTEIRPAAEFYPAEQYHQNYHRKNPLRYKFYRFSCGRDQRLKELWGSAEP
jgi:peptide-methionine (S)-S-oxide reductase